MWSWFNNGGGGGGGGARGGGEERESGGFLELNLRSPDIENVGVLRDIMCHISSKLKDIVWLFTKTVIID